MIKKTKLKIVFTVEMIIATMFFIICISILLTSYTDYKKHSKDLLDRITKEATGGHPKPAQSRSFFARIYTDYTVVDYDQRFFTEEEVNEYINAIVKKNNEYGDVKNIMYKITINRDFTIISGVDVTVEKNMLNQTLVYMLSFGIPGLIGLGMIMWFLSGLIMNPLKKNMENQKIFVSDASHELKTPITSILINVDVLEGEHGSNKWSDNIKSQAERLLLLSNELLTLSKLDETKIAERVKLNLSNLFKNEIFSLETVAYENDRILDARIDDDIYIYANEIETVKLINIFFDNAIKHSNKGGTISIRLSNPNKPELSIYNTTTQISLDEKESLFNRFYRGDNSRSRITGGSGLGLSIAKKIIENNKWKINVNIQENVSIKFVIVF